ncbi:MAG: carboxypeptidase-like regulatory domain-containing protein [Pirellulaceae bacterium]
MRFVCNFLVALVFAIVCGCGEGGPDVQPVTGKVTVDGAAVAGVMVTLVGDGGSAMGLTGITDNSGVFSITAAGGYQGAPSGKYKVVVSPPQPEMDYSTGVPGKQMEFPSKYSSPDSSELTTVEVGSEPTVVNIDVVTK